LEEARGLWTDSGECTDAKSTRLWIKLYKPITWIPLFAFALFVRLVIMLPGRSF
jgi:hypothetical protein